MIAHKSIANKLLQTPHVIDFKRFESFETSPIASAIDILNVLASPKKPYWLFIFMEKK